MSHWPDYAKLSDLVGQCDPKGSGYFVRKDKGTCFYDLVLKVDGAKQTGWKFHVSIDPRDTARAWNLISAQAMFMNAPYLKVVEDPSLFSVATDKQAGKTITIYVLDTAVAWPQLMQSIESTMAKHGIRPGQEVQGDRRIPGSRYLYYRNDRTLPGQSFEDVPVGYSPASRIKDVPVDRRFNPHGFPDPFATLEVVPGFPKIDWAHKYDKQHRLYLELPVSDLTQPAIKGLEDALRHYRFHPLREGSVICLVGKDAKRYADTAVDLFHPLPEPKSVPTPLPPQSSDKKVWVEEVLGQREVSNFNFIVRHQEWVPFTDPQGNHVMYLPLCNLTREESTAIHNILERVKMPDGKPAYQPLYRSFPEAGGEVMYVIGTEADRLHHHLNQPQTARSTADR